MSMARVEFERLSTAWRGEATDFTPLLAERLDQLGEAIGLSFLGAGETEVPTAGGRRIDIVASTGDGTDIVIENQYGDADHDHLTRGLAYAVAAEARGLVIVAERHRDEFRAVARYLNDLAEHQPEKSIAVWLVEARAVRIADSPWAPIFHPVVEPNSFTAEVESRRAASRHTNRAAYLALVDDPQVEAATVQLIERWQGESRRVRFSPTAVILEAPGPSRSGRRSVFAIGTDGRVVVPFGSFGGQNSGISIDELVDGDFRERANAWFGFDGSETQARTAPGWFVPERVDHTVSLAMEVADAYSRHSS